MKNFIFMMILFSGFANAGMYSCSGSNLDIEVTANPIEVSVKGRGLDLVVKKVKYVSTFNSIFSGNAANSNIIVKLTVKDNNGAVAGDVVKGDLELSGSAGVQKFQDLTCVRGND